MACLGPVKCTTEEPITLRFHYMNIDLVAVCSSLLFSFLTVDIASKNPQKWVSGEPNSSEES